MCEVNENPTDINELTTKRTMMETNNIFYTRNMDERNYEHEHILMMTMMMRMMMKNLPSNTLNMCLRRFTDIKMNLTRPDEDNDDEDEEEE